MSELDRPGRVVLDPRELGRENFGHVVEARTFGAAVKSKINEMQELAFLCPASVSAIRVTEAVAQVEYEGEGGPGRISASLLVGR